MGLAFIKLVTIILYICICWYSSYGTCFLCDVYPATSRVDCYPDPDPTLDKCNKRGCCWREEDGLSGLPICYFPLNYPSYDVESWNSTDYGYKSYLIKNISSPSPWPNDILKLTLEVWLETKTCVHFKIYDSSVKRYEVPIGTPPPTKIKTPTTDYSITFSKSPFGLKVTRKTTGSVLFDSTNIAAPLIFADQFLQITTLLSSPFLFGIGERYGPLLLNASSSWTKFFLWAKDQQPIINSNLYGSHAFYINSESNSDFHGVFLLNSNAMEVIVQPEPSVTFRSIGGVFDFYIFTGPSPDDVIQQYVQIIGLPALPPYWGLGFHLCRFNYKSSDRLKMIIERNRKLKIPYEAQWNDIDYMEMSRDWTFDQVAYKGLPEVVADLHQHDQKYVMIVDPAISNQQPGSYSPYDFGIEKNIFIKNAYGDILEGKVWPGYTVFPDFTHPNATQWWYEAAAQFYKILPFDGLWIDMNEPSNFVSGSTKGCTSDYLDNPPYVPGIHQGDRLESKTICASSQQFLSSHYNLHNLYGLFEAIATRRALETILQKRSIVVSRSSFPSLGKYAQHWTGDVKATWQDLYYSVPSILSFQFFGIPFVGADVCGFAGDTTEELCIRWMQLGAFYPFMRNHNDDSSKDQDPGAFSVTAQKIMKNALEIRYSLLPFFYTQFVINHITGSPVIKPLFFLFPKDPAAYTIDRQFIWGSSLLVTPVLEQGAFHVQCYFPQGMWYDLFSGSLIKSPGKYYDLNAPLETINVHIRGGSIIPIQEPNTTTTFARRNPFVLVAALNETKQAEGFLFWDDGETLVTIEQGLYSKFIFMVNKNSFLSTVTDHGYVPSEGLKLDSVIILGVEGKPSNVLVNGHTVHFNYDEKFEVLTLTDLKLNFFQPVNINWS